MTLATPTDDWSATVTLAVPTLFQARAGAVLLDIGAAAPVGSTDAYVLEYNRTQEKRNEITLPAGVDVRWRKMVPGAQAVFYYVDLA